MLAYVVFHNMGCHFHRVYVYLVRIDPIFYSSDSSCLTRYQKVLSVCSFECKNVLNFTLFSMIFHNRHYTIKGRPLSSCGGESSSSVESDNFLTVPQTVTASSSAETLTGNLNFIQIIKEWKESINSFTLGFD